MPHLRKATVNRRAALQRRTGLNPRSPKAHRRAMRTWEEQGHRIVVQRQGCEVPACVTRPVDDHHYMHRLGRIPELWSHHPALRVRLCDPHHDMAHGIGGTEAQRARVQEQLGHIVMRRMRATWPEVEQKWHELAGMVPVDVIRRLVAYLCAQGIDPRERPTPP